MLEKRCQMDRLRFLVLIYTTLCELACIGEQRQRQKLPLLSGPPVAKAPMHAPLAFPRNAVPFWA